MQKKMFLGSVFITLLILNSSCNSYYSKLDKKFPVTSKDSAHLANRCNVTFPTDTISQKIEIINSNDSSAFYNSKIDSLKAVKQKVKTQLEIKYKDTCTSLLFEVSNALNTGWEQGYYEGKLAAKKDTTWIIKTITKESTIKIQLANSQAAEYQAKLIKEAKSKSQWKTGCIVVSIFAFMFLLFAFLFGKYLARPKLKAV